MKNIANNRGKIGQREKIFSSDKSFSDEKTFSLHVRYLSFLSVLLILLFAAFWGLSRLRSMADRSQTDRDSALSGLLYTSFSDACAALRAASGSEESDEYGRELRIAGEAVERMLGGCALYGDLRSQRLGPYLEQLSENCAALSERAALGIVTGSDRALCMRLADQIDRLTEDKGALLSPDAGGRLDLRISPYLAAGWELR